MKYGTFVIYQESLINRLQVYTEVKRGVVMAVVENKVSGASGGAAVESAASAVVNGQDQTKQNGMKGQDQFVGSGGGDVGGEHGSDGGDDFKRDMRELQELFSKLNPMAEEFVPPSLAGSNNNLIQLGINGAFFANNSIFLPNGNDTRNGGHVNGNGILRRVVKNCSSFLNSF